MAKLFLVACLFLAAVHASVAMSINVDLIPSRVQNDASVSMIEVAGSKPVKNNEAAHNKPTLAQKAVTAVKKVGTSIKDGVKSAATATKNTLKKAASATKNTLKKAGSKAVNIVKKGLAKGKKILKAGAKAALNALLGKNKDKNQGKNQGKNKDKKASSAIKKVATKALTAEEKKKAAKAEKEEKIRLSKTYKRVEDKIVQDLETQFGKEGMRAPGMKSYRRQKGKSSVLPFRSPDGDLRTVNFDDPFPPYVQHASLFNKLDKFDHGASAATAIRKAKENKAEVKRFLIENLKDENTH